MVNLFKQAQVIFRQVHEYSMEIKMKSDENRVNMCCIIWAFYIL